MLMCIKDCYADTKEDAEATLTRHKQNRHAPDFAEVVEVTDETPLTTEPPPVISEIGPSKCILSENARRKNKWLHEYLNGYLDDEGEPLYSLVLHNILIAKGWKYCEEIDPLFGEDFNTIKMEYTHKKHPYILHWYR